jgi:isoquinoline 1-oxidoreductase alpha subunit
MTRPAEVVGKTPQGKALQQAWLDLEVVQCGYCQSGQIMSAAALLANTPKPSDEGRIGMRRNRAPIRP